MLKPPEPKATKLAQADQTKAEVDLELRDEPPPNRGQGWRVDYKYERVGTANLFVMVKPKGGYRHVIVREQRTGRDYAEALRWLVEEGYPNAVEIEVVQDNLKTHLPSALYKAFAPGRARAILDKLRFTYTPKHGSWLNQAEIEIGVFERVCLDGRYIESLSDLSVEVAALEAERNQNQAKIEWQFTCEAARTKLVRLYPKLTELT